MKYLTIFENVPGVVWVLALVASMAVAHRYISDPVLADIVIAGLFVILRSINVKSSDLDEARGFIQELQSYIDLMHAKLENGDVEAANIIPEPTSEAEQQMRGPVGAITAMHTTSIPPAQVRSIKIPPPPSHLMRAVPPPRSKLKRWLLG